jgi:uncharacterized membrane protein
MCIAQAADVLGTGIVAGAFFMGTFAVHPAAGRLEASPHVALRQELIRRLAIFLPPFMFLPILASVAALTLCRASISSGLDAVGCVLSLSTIAITMAINVPLNRRIAGWSPERLPSDWQDLVRQWNSAHVIRMTVAVGAFLCAILAAS